MMVRPKPKTRWQQKKVQIENNWKLFRETKYGLIGVVIIVFFVGMGVISFIPPLIDEMYDPLYGIDLDVIGVTHPSLKHPLGTDFMGRDIFSQLLEGSKWALIIGGTAAVCTVTLSTVIGLVSGYYGGIVDSLLQRTADIVMSLPGLAIVLVVGVVSREIGIWNIVILISILGWPGASKVIRSQVLSLRERPYIESARVSGCSNLRIIFKHIAPNVLPISFLYVAFYVRHAILFEAALSFMGMGDTSIVTWGKILSWCFSTRYTFTAPFWIVPPGLCITVLTLAFYLIGVGTEHIINPRLRKR
jgi:peptide/nickel transport system permease protein